MSDTSSAAAPKRPLFDLFLVSWLILFLELACIRWFPSHVVFLTFFTNVVLLACFLGMSVGCLAAGSRFNFLQLTPLLLWVALLVGLSMEFIRNRFNVELEVGQKGAQVVYFGAEAQGEQDIARFVVPIQVVCAFFFLLLALIFIGPGQVLGRALNAVPDRIKAYSINIGGSVAGIVAFAALSWFELSPLWWLVPIAVALTYFLWQRSFIINLCQMAVLAFAVLLSAYNTGVSGEPGHEREHWWSPYYRISYDRDSRGINVNLIGHQQMAAIDHRDAPAYALPHLLNRDSAGKPFKRVLIIGAGSGNDVTRALQWGAERVDAVEIDPVIQRLGKQYHPNRPYDDPRVHVTLDDGRNFLHSAEPGTYDLVVYALVDSLVLHSSQSNIRLESYLFTHQAFEDVKRVLKPDGVFVMYNFFRQDWIVARLRQTLAEVFGKPPIVIALPYREVIDPNATDLKKDIVMFLAGDTGRIGQKFDASKQYWVPAGQPLDPGKTPNGFTHPDAAERERQRDRMETDRSAWRRFGPADVKESQQALMTPTDDWPFLYLRDRRVPDPSIQGILIMAGVAAVLLWVFRPRAARSGPRNGWNLQARMFLLGAGFMLVETKAVVHMALLFGSTWMVNSIVFFAVLVMILLANLFVLAVRPRNLVPYYIGLLVTLALNAFIPLEAFLGMSRTLQVASSCLLVFAPILFAAVVFALSFAHSPEPDRAIGANIAGAMLGGLAENSSMIVGFQYLVLVALLFYVLAISCRLPSSPARTT